MSEEEAIKLLKYKTLMFNNDVYLGDVLDKQNIEAINILLRYIEQLQQENEELFIENMKLKNKLEQQRKEIGWYE